MSQTYLRLFFFGQCPHTLSHYELHTVHVDSSSPRNWIFPSSETRILHMSACECICIHVRVCVFTCSFSQTRTSLSSCPPKCGTWNTFMEAKSTIPPSPKCTSLYLSSSLWKSSARTTFIVLGGNAFCHPLSQTCNLH